jgi:hypothetical protein
MNIAIGCMIIQIALVIFGIFYVSYFKGITNILLGWFLVLANLIGLGINISILVR